jgi:hypothetical protein
MGRNILWNFLGQGGPLIAALFTVPIVIGALGNEWFGVRAIVSSEQKKSNLDCAAGDAVADAARGWQA